MNITTPPVKGFDFDAIRWVRDQVRGLSRDQHHLLLILATHCNPDHECWPSQKTLAGEMQCSPRHVWSLLKALDDKGLIRRKRRQNRSTVYMLCISDSQTGAKPDSQHVAKPDSQTDALEETIGSNQKKEPVEVLSERTAPSASALGTGSEKDNREKGEELAQNFQTRCRFDPASRLGFYMRCGRLHTKADHFHRPKDPGKPLTYSQLDALRIWFEQLPTTGCHVMNFAMKNWPQIRAQYCKTHSKWNGIHKTPTISALEKIGSSEKSGPEFLYGLWQQFQREAMLARVEENVLGAGEAFWEMVG